MRHLLVFLIGIFFVACSGSNPPSAAAPAATLTTTSTATPSPTIDVDSASVQDLAQRNSDFAVEFYRQVAAQNDGNLIFSPYSISLAFSMVYAGARKDTESQIANVFHFLPQNAQHITFRGLGQLVNAQPPWSTIGENSGAPFQLNIANATWGQQGFPFKPEFTNVLAQSYDAELQQADFARQASEIAREINAWIANATENRITEMVGPDTLDAETKLVLVNAVYFKGSWQLPFSASQTLPGTFTLANNETVRVPFMHHSAARVPYLENADYQALQLPYVGEKADMVVILPREGRLQAVEQGLSRAALQEIRAGAELHDVLHDVTLAMPRFEFETDLDLTQLLPQLGITDAFIGKADFGGISEGGGLSITHALHHSTITVDEEGTEAAAASAIALATSAYERAEMTLNRPFLFAIVERETGTVLFLGRVMNPAP